MTTFSHSVLIGRSVIILDAGLEHALVYTAQRAAPVIGKVLEFGSGSNAVLGIALILSVIPTVCVRQRVFPA